MGMFDSVYAPCARCGNHIEIQSKAGECCLQIFSINSVPIAVADDLDGEVVHCEKCETTNVVTIQKVPATTTIALKEM